MKTIEELLCWVSHAKHTRKETKENDRKSVRKITKDDEIYLAEKAFDKVSQRTVWDGLKT